MSTTSPRIPPRIVTSLTWKATKAQTTMACKPKSLEELGVDVIV